MGRARETRSSRSSEGTVQALQPSEGQRERENERVESGPSERNRQSERAPPAAAPAQTRPPPSTETPPPTHSSLIESGQHRRPSDRGTLSSAPPR